MEVQSSLSIHICEVLSFEKEVCLMAPQKTDLRPMNGNNRKV